jgi:hypothetical protein
MSRQLGSRRLLEPAMVAEQLDRAVEDSVVVRLKKALLF